MEKLENENLIRDKFLKVNLIVVFDESWETMLMCKRLKPPYQGLYNMVGGKTRPGEDSLSAAYRELFEETGISSSDISLVRIMDLSYYLEECVVEVYFGTIPKEFPVYGEENPLLWMDLKENFFDSTKFSGEGNIGHIVEVIFNWQDKIKSQIKLLERNKL